MEIIVAEYEPGERVINKDGRPSKTTILFAQEMGWMLAGIILEPGQEFPIDMLVKDRCGLGSSQDLLNAATIDKKRIIIVKKRQEAWHPSAWRQEGVVFESYSGICR